MSDVFTNRNRDEKPAATPAPRPSSPRRAGATSSPSAPRRADEPRRPGGGRQLVVGREISLNGEIKDCEELIVEGRVEAALTSGDFLVVAEGGVFKGPANVREAEINGTFDGELNVSEKLIVKPQGRVTGVARYGVLEVHAGGVIAGQLEPRKGE